MRRRALSVRRASLARRERSSSAGWFASRILRWRLVKVAHDDVDVAGVASAAHGDVGELSAAAAGEDVSAIDSRPLHSVDGDRVGEVEPVATDLFAGEERRMTVVEKRTVSCPWPIAATVARS